MRSLLIFRNELLPVSETFILAQAASIRRYSPWLVGLTTITPSLDLPRQRVLLSEGSSIVSRSRRLAYQLAGIAPSFHRHLRKLSAVVMHAHFALDATNALFAAEKLQLPLIVTLHGSDVTRTDRAHQRSFSGRLFLQRREKLFKTASMFICVSNFIKEQALAAGFPQQKLLVHYIGIDLETYRAVPGVLRESIVLFVGRLTKQKGCAFLLQAMQDVQRRNPGVRLVVIGSGPLKRELEQQALTSGVSASFLGSQPISEVRLWMQRAKIFCVPSSREGLGMVFAEAQALGLPVVSFADGGIPEVVLHRQTGLLAPEGDEKALAEYLLDLLQNGELWNSFSRSGREWIHENFDITKQTPILESLYSLLAPSA